jgi:hypothetical protein
MKNETAKAGNGGLRTALDLLFLLLTFLTLFVLINGLAG